MNSKGSGKPFIVAGQSPESRPRFNKVKSFSLLFFTSASHEMNDGQIIFLRAIGSNDAGFASHINQTLPKAQPVTFAVTTRHRAVTHAGVGPVTPIIIRFACRSSRLETQPQPLICIMPCQP
jgi:hypothetical protein